MCGEQDIAFLPFFAIAGTSRHRGAATAESEQVVDVARAHDATVAQILLAWSLHQGPHVLAIPGTGKTEHLVENVAAGAIRLSPDELAYLDSVSVSR